MGLELHGKFGPAGGVCRFCIVSVFCTIFKYCSYSTLSAFFVQLAFFVQFLDTCKTVFIQSIRLFVLYKI